ncbi:CD74 molecule, major histocompatibility complex, class II invariant chain a isoform X1 [Silurus meridionalis]|uniref:CD74 molecule, major histocompatibility complex, class II invariant chain a isoform X1 n=1 Tax=Silurus meridionalis TaxID=175797 RepID=UPI001EEA6B5A|nr:CD74 molecule, major histocompatibility complex, class II invariant chain a isoform X1 [Silurus meridionalis]
MDQDDALLERASSSETMTEQRRTPNGKAVKVAGLTVLACLLLAGQAFTAYYVMRQKDHLQSLEQGQDTLKKELSRMLTVAPKMMRTPMSKMPMLMAIDQDGSKQPLSKIQPSYQIQKEGSGLVDEGLRPAGRMAVAMNHMPMLVDINADKVEKEPETTNSPVVLVEKKCKIEAEKVKPGFYQPQCDEEGNYKPKQCWHSTGYCWCVDKNGNRIAGTESRDHVDCGNVN